MADPIAAAIRRGTPGGYDVVISGYNNLGGLSPWPQEVKDAFAAYIRGGGFYAFHEANNGTATSPLMAKIQKAGKLDA